MKQLKQITLVQFYLHEASDIQLDGATAFLGPNGSGKSTTLDAIQLAMLGGNQNYVTYNTQSVSNKKGRSLTSYCLGILRSPDSESKMVGRARDEARTYIILVFSDGTDMGTLSAGFCVEADSDSEKHEIKGLFILPGQCITAKDCIVLEGKSQIPMPYPDFREHFRERSKIIGRTPIFTDKSGEYVSELLYALNGQRMPDSKRFMSSFVKSMTLKNVDSIDQFVRAYVVEPNPVDIAAFQKQVAQFVSLREMIKETKAKISQLTGVLKEYEQAKRNEIKCIALKAVKTVFDVEYLAEQIVLLEDEIDQLTVKCKDAENKADQTQQERVHKQNEVTELKIILETDKTEQRRLRYQNEIDVCQKLIEAYQQPEIGRANRLINAVRDLMGDNELRGVSNEMRIVVDKLVLERGQHNPAMAVAQAFLNLNTELTPIKNYSEQSFRLLTIKHTKLSDEYSESRLRISAATKTGRLISSGPAQLLELLSNAGIKSEPISALARITDSSWAPVIEAYLGGDRDALVITVGDVREAVRILRDARRQGLPIGGAAIIQPNHLKNVDTCVERADYAVGIIECDNDTARKFLWKKLGNMRLVHTEIELETFARSITQDGMLSQGGLTKSIQLLSLNELRIGRKVEDIADLCRHMATLEGELTHIKTRLDKFHRLTSALNDKGISEEQDTLSELDKAHAKKAKAEKQLGELDVSHVSELRAKFNDAEVDLGVLEGKYKQLLTLAAGLENEKLHRYGSKKTIEDKMPIAKEIEQRAFKNELIDMGIMDTLKSEIERIHVEYGERINEVERRVKIHNERTTTHIEKATLELSKYSQHLPFATMNWHDRHQWTIDEKVRLTETHLQHYEDDAEQARIAAEDTLRSDIAMSLNDRFKEMELERRERNKVLDSCPAFTGGEKYRFTSSVIPKYKSLVDYINQIAQNEQNLSLFTTDTEELDQVLRALIAEAAESNDARGVLDYRQFFNFDLEILVDGRCVERMSNRQGAGSNGEHITPMYIAAGAALAKAYRLQNRKGQQTGTGIICLDEAFYGMDTTNALATARFLNSIGLQLVMAADENQRTKLAPISQTIYDLDREDFDLLMERTKFTPQGNALLVSDMPYENPQVVADAYEELGLTPPEPTKEEVIKDILE